MQIALANDGRGLAVGARLALRDINQGTATDTLVGTLVAKVAGLALEALAGCPWRKIAVPAGSTTVEPALADVAFALAGEQASRTARTLAAL
jgi:hypothetical protein